MLLKNNCHYTPKRLVSCYLYNVAKMTVIPAEAGIQKPEVAKNNIFPLPDQVEDRLRGNDECLIRYFTHDATIVVK